MSPDNLLINFKETDNINKIKISEFKMPVYKWTLHINKGFCMQFEEGKQPNWFHRKMQELILGFKWGPYD